MRLLRSTILAALSLSAFVAAPQALADTNQTVLAVVVSSCGTASYTAGQPNRPVTQDTTGKLCDSGGSSTPTVSGSVAINDGTTTSQKATVDTSGNLHVSSQAATTSGAITTTPVVANLSAGVIVKASSGNLYGAYAKNATTTAGFLIAYNTTSVPTGGTSLTPALILECLPLPATTQGLSTISYIPGPPEAFSVGIVLLVSSTDCAVASPVYTTGTVTAYLHGIAQ